VKKAISLSALLMAAGLLLPFLGFPSQTGTGTAAPSSTGAKPAKAKGTPSPEAIAEAKAQGLVWVNTATRAYHKDGPLYGKTKLGKFMKEKDAQNAGYRLASPNGPPSK
jgi:hypothetical protein